MINNITTFFTSEGLLALQNFISTSKPVTFSKLEISEGMFSEEPAVFPPVGQPYYRVTPETNNVLRYVSISPFVDGVTSDNLINVVVDLNEVLPVPQSYSLTNVEGWVVEPIDHPLNVLEIGSYAIYVIDPVSNLEVVLCYASYNLTQFEKISYIFDQYLGNQVTFNSGVKLSSSDISQIMIQLVNSPLAMLPVYKNIYSLTKTSESPNLPKTIFLNESLNLVGVDYNNNWTLFDYKYYLTSRITNITTSLSQSNTIVNLKVDTNSNKYLEMLLLNSEQFKLNSVVIQSLGDLDLIIPTDSKSLLYYVSSIVKDADGYIVITIVAPTTFYNTNNLKIGESVNVFYYKDLLNSLTYSKILLTSFGSNSIDIELPNSNDVKEITYSFINETNDDYIINFFVNAYNPTIKFYGLNQFQCSLLALKNKKYSTVTFKSDIKSYWYTTSYINFSEI